MKKEINLSDEFTVDFLKNNNGGKPICRIEGIVAFIDKNCPSFVVPCSTWMVRVISVHEKFLTIEPLIKVRTPKENEQILQSKIQALKTVKKERTKAKNNYQYCSFQELKEINNNKN